MVETPPRAGPYPPHGPARFLLPPRPVSERATPKAAPRPPPAHSAGHAPAPQRQAPRTESSRAHPHPAPSAPLDLPTPPAAHGSRGGRLPPAGTATARRG